MKRCYPKLKKLILRKSILSTPICPSDSTTTPVTISFRDVEFKLPPWCVICQSANMTDGRNGLTKIEFYFILALTPQTSVRPFLDEVVRMHMLMLSNFSYGDHQIHS
jgi:hypothetical protein